MDTNEKDIKNVTRKIKALLAKTVEAGATEAEAMSAFTKAHDLLREYQLNLSDLDLREEGTSKKETAIDKISKELMVRVAQYCECKTWMSGREKQVKKVGKRKVEFTDYTKINFLGIKSDADFAEWLLFALTHYVAGQEMNFLFSNDNWSKYSGDDFVTGIVYRINERLDEEVKKRELDKFTSTGRDLVPLKNAMINDAFAKLGITLRTTKSTESRIFDTNAFNQGMEKGNGVSFNRPVYDNRDEQRLIK